MRKETLTYDIIKNYVESKGCNLLTTREEFEQEKSKGKISTNKIKLKILCSCGKESFTKSFNNFKTKNQTQCKKCGYNNISKSKSLSYEEIREYVNNPLTGNNCVLDMTKDEFINIKNQENKSFTKIKLKIKCGICGESFYTTFNNFKTKKKQCNECGDIIKSKKASRTTEQFKQEVYELVGDEYTVLGEYINSQTKILMRHNCIECNNYEFEMTPNQFLNRNDRCPKCGGAMKKTTNQFKQEVYELVGDEYTVLGEYINANAYILMRHNSKRCNNYEYMVTPSNFLRGKRCPKCKKSKGEKRIERCLENNKIHYKSQYRIKECRDKYPLPFDFAIFNDETKTDLKYLIEYDGELHYREYNKIQNSLEKFKTTQFHDSLKNKYCIDNNIELIRIPYWKFENIEEILKSKVEF